MKSIILALALLAVGAAASAQEPNHLLGEDSPYLQQHLYNAVDWYPWGSEALDKAKAENKPIFLSVGYSSCHWCHVMEEESFEDAAIGAFLNEHFVSIKIDRERRPDLDEQFMLVTQSLTGGGGWPNSVFMTSSADPFYAGTYFPPDVFLDVIRQIQGTWETDSAELSASAAEFSALVRDYMQSTAAAKDLTPEAVRAAANDILADIDEFNGGLGVAPKFPRESTFLFLLDQAQRDGNAEMLSAVLGALDGMLMGGIHDHVGGGFHRYATDPEWHVPHFEKMLYNQAMIGRLLVRAWEITGDPLYRRAAERTFDYVLREMTDPAGGFYSAQDADSINAAGEFVEGAFYTWTPTQVRAVLGADAAAMIEAFNITDEGNFDNANSIHLLGVADFAVLDPLLDKLRAARLERSAPFKDRKIITAWNGAMIATLAEASHTFDRPDYYYAAAKAANFILSNMVTGDGLHRVSYEGRPSVPAQLTDYANFGLALVALHDYGNEAQDWLQSAETMATEISARFGEKDKAYRMTEVVEGLGAFYPVDDAEVPAGNALVLHLLVGLGHRMEAPLYTQEALALAAALSANALAAPEARGYSLKGSQILNFGETGSVRSVASGAVRVTTDVDRVNRTFSVVVDVKEGWHVNAHTPLEDYFIPTGLTIADVPILPEVYPEPVVKPLSFNDKLLALYEGELRLSGSIPDGTKPVVAVLTLQTCNDEICLQPEELRFTIW